MSIATSAPIVFLNRDELTELAEDFSERLRCDPILRPKLDFIVGNQWEQLEKGFIGALASELSMQPLPHLPAQRLSRIAYAMSNDDCERVRHLFLDVVFSRFPFSDASRLAEIGDDIFCWVQPLLGHHDIRVRQRSVIESLRSWQANRLRSSF